MPDRLTSPRLQALRQRYFEMQRDWNANLILGDQSHKDELMSWMLSKKFSQPVLDVGVECIYDDCPDDAACRRWDIADHANETMDDSAWRKPQNV